MIRVVFHLRNGVGKLAVSNHRRQVIPDKVLVLGSTKPARQLTSAARPPSTEIKDHRAQGFLAWFAASGLYPSHQLLGRIGCHLVRIRRDLVRIRRNLVRIRCHLVRIVALRRRIRHKLWTGGVISPATTALHLQQRQVTQAAKVARGVKGVRAIDGPVGRIVDGAELPDKNQRPGLFV